MGAVDQSVVVEAVRRWLAQNAGPSSQARAEYQETEPLFQRSLRIVEKALGLSIPMWPRASRITPTCSGRMNRTTEAATLEARAEAIRARGRWGDARDANS
jgi:hypothetical protein